MKKQNRADSSKRSDILRQKRLEKQNEWLQNVNTRAEKIETRTASESYAQVQRGFQAPQRETNPLAHIDTTDQEYTLPKFHLSWRFFSATIAIVCTFLLVSAFRSPTYRISDIQLSGVERLSPEEIIATIDLQDELIFLVSPFSAEQTIQKNYPELHSIQVSLSLPAKVQIEVSERTPEMAWIYEGKKIWIDNEGYLLPGRGEIATTLSIQANKQPPFYIPEDRLILKGEKRLRKTVVAKGDQDHLALFQVYERIDPITHQAIHELHQLLPEQEIILFDDRRGLGWNDGRGFQVFVGSDLRDIAAKMNMVEEILKTLQPSGIQPTMISLEEINAPYYRLD